MGAKQADVIGGVNLFLREQQALPDPCRLSLAKFNTEVTVVHAARPIGDVRPLTGQAYVPGGNTALFDAVAQAVRLADRDKRADERVLCLIVTDGEENSSRETSGPQVEAIIREREARGDWTFTYLGVAPGHWVGLGLAAGNTAGYQVADPAASFAAMSRATYRYRSRPDRQSRDFYAPDSA
jgi:hypothetical protein